MMLECEDYNNDLGCGVLKFHVLENMNFNVSVVHIQSQLDFSMKIDVASGDFALAKCAGMNYVV